LSVKRDRAKQAGVIAAVLRRRGNVHEPPQRLENLAFLH
jgi:hypothetical protein